MTRFFRILTSIAFLFSSHLASIEFCFAEEFPIISRSEWGARPFWERSADGNCSDYFSFPDYFEFGENDSNEEKLKKIYRGGRVIVHHTAQLFEQNAALQKKYKIDKLADSKLLRCIQEIHMYANGWDDLGYHFYISKNGQVYEGRPLSRIGGNAGAPLNLWAKDSCSRLGDKRLDIDYDFQSIGVVLQGDFEKEVPTTKQLSTLQKFVSYLAEKYGVNKLDYHKHFRVIDGGNKGSPATLCPGKNLLKEIVRLRFDDPGVIEFDQTQEKDPVYRTWKPNRGVVVDDSGRVRDQELRCKMICIVEIPPPIGVSSCR